MTEEGRRTVGCPSHVARVATDFAMSTAKSCRFHWVKVACDEYEGKCEEAMGDNGCRGVLL